MLRQRAASDVHPDALIHLRRGPACDLVAREQPAARCRDFDRFDAPWRTRTRALAARVWARRSSV